MSVTRPTLKFDFGAVLVLAEVVELAGVDVEPVLLLAPPPVLELLLLLPHAASTTATATTPMAATTRRPILAVTTSPLYGWKART
jgi:hypothetical protein